MIKVTIELLPLGSEKHKKHLGTIKISNLGTGNKTSGNYRYSLLKKNYSKLLSGTISNFPRKRLGAHYLLYQVLKDAFGDDDK